MVDVVWLFDGFCGGASDTGFVSRAENNGQGDGIESGGDIVVVVDMGLVVGLGGDDYCVADDYVVDILL